ncbi:hypothetical protein GBAR_LOCUS8358 [Geodia barretti]|uniref:Uncharacterized protein n=1 Tax=Geodia barretti TaxID=519541 RepID=A0AA35WDD2_GEOBA|nr:hypothetical protein GBAR_LOCUS8358 [Geodia barretti]
MVDRIFGNSSYLRTPAPMSAGSSLPQTFVLVVRVGQLPYTGPTVQQDSPHLARRQADQYVLTLP